MSDDSSYVLLARWRDFTDQQAAAELVGRYAGRLVALARSRMEGKLARRLDPADVVQSVCKSFFVRIRDGRLELQPGSDLWQLLAAITIHKVLKQVKHHTAAKRSLQREQHPGPDDRLNQALETVAGEPATGELTAVTEEIDQALQPLSPLHRQMVQLRLQEYTLVEIAKQTGRTERMVQIVLDKFGRHLQRRLRAYEDLPAAGGSRP